MDALRDAGVRTVILDECHHVVSLWGYLVRAALTELGDDVHVIGLTATAPDDMTADEAALYQELLGPVDFHTPTPAVVREGFLAPFQELALFTTPLDSELEWLHARHERFRTLIDSLMDATGRARLPGVGLEPAALPRGRRRGGPVRRAAAPPAGAGARRAALPRLGRAAAAAGRAARRGLPRAAVDR